MADDYKDLGAIAIDGAGGNTVATDIALYTVPPDKVAIVNWIRIYNYSANVATIKLAFPKGAIGTVIADDYIYNPKVIPAGHSIDILGVPSLQTTYTIMIRSDIVSVSFMAYGCEKDV